MFLLEKLKKTFLKQPSQQPLNVTPNKIQSDLTNTDDYLVYRSFFDSEYNNLTGALNSAQVYKQAEKIDLYRKIAEYPEVSDAIDEIVDEICYTQDLEEFLKIECDTDNKQLDNAIVESFEEILKLMNIDKNIYDLIRQIYIDGQGNILCEYHEGKLVNLKYIDPKYLTFDFEKGVYKYVDEYNSLYLTRVMQNGQQRNYRKTTTDAEIINEYNIDEVVHIDFGKIDNKEGLILSYLERAIKPANMLKTLEDLLIPLRFSRSISRRVFNVDVSDLPTSKAEMAMKKIQEQFKYKKFLNTETGEVTNQQHITGMVEDYWFANRNGQKGTSVDTIDETGNLGELGDIMYFYKKLYRSLGIPTNRISTSDEDKNFDYDSSQITKEDFKFYLFINRLRKIYIDMFVNILKRHVITKGIMSEDEFNQYQDKIKIFFVGENYYLERMKLANFEKRLNIYSSARDYSGTLFSVEYLYKNIFKFDDDEIKEMMTEIQKEKKNPLFKHLYEDPMEFQ